MKRKLLPIIIALALIMSVFFCACGDTAGGGNDPADNTRRDEIGSLTAVPGTPSLPPKMKDTMPEWEKLSSSERAEVAHAYCTMIKANYYERVYEPDIYYGEYNGAYVLLDDLYKHLSPTLWREEIAGVVFDYNDGNSIDVCKDGEIVPIAEAYERGWLADKDIEEIGKIHEQAYYAYGRGKDNLDLIYDEAGNILVSDGEVKQYCRIDENSDKYVYGKFVLIFTHKASMQGKTYTLEDFPEIEAEEVRTLGDVLFERIRKWQEDPSSFPERDWEYYRRMEKTFNQMAFISIKEQTAEATMKALELLQKRTDIWHVSPDYVVSVADD